MFFTRRILFAFLSNSRNSNVQPTRKNNLGIYLIFTFMFCCIGEADPIGYPDEYGLEDVSINVGDFMQKLTKSNFSVAWDGIGIENEMEETYSLTQIGTLSEAVKLIIDHLGMNPSERTDSVDDEKSTHALLLTGT